GDPEGMDAAPRVEDPAPHPVRAHRYRSRHVKIRPVRRRKRVQHHAPKWMEPAPAIEGDPTMGTQPGLVGGHRLGTDGLGGWGRVGRIDENDVTHDITRAEVRVTVP